MTTRDRQYPARAFLPAAMVERLVGYVRRKDRAYPPVFGGRREELEFLRETVDEVAKEGTPGLTVSITGVPGIGKTALATRFMKELAGRADERIFHVDAPSSFFRRPPFEIALALTESIAGVADRPGWRGLLDKAGREITSGRSRFGASVRRVGSLLARKKSLLDVTAESMRIGENTDLDVVFDRFRRRFWPENPTFVVVMDETQNMVVDARTRLHVSAIHECRFPVNIVLVAFGLPPTVERLEEAGISRLATGNNRRLAVLEDREAEGMVRATLAWLGFDDAEPAWHAALAAHGWGAGVARMWSATMTKLALAESAGFPHHLTNAMQAVCKATLYGKLNKEVCEPFVLAECRAAKDNFYTARTDDFADGLTAVSGLVAGFGGQFSRAAAVAFVGACPPGDALKPMGGRGARAMLEAMATKGLLRRERDDYMIAIPSMTDWLRTRFAREVRAGNEIALAVAEVGRERWPGLGFLERPATPPHDSRY